MDKNMRNSLISVVMSVYNGGDYLHDAIKSVLNQTYTNFEFIIINDGSTDQSLRIIESYSKYDKRIKIINQFNTGLAIALNNGIKESKGKYIARIDADDICEKRRFEIQFNFLEINPEYVLVGSAVNYIDKNGTYLGRSFPILKNKQISKALYYYSPIAHPSVMMRRKELIEVGGYNEIINSQFEDHFLWYLLKDKGKLKNLPIPLIKYRILPQSLSSNQNSKEYKELKLSIIRKKGISISEKKQLDKLRQDTINANIDNENVRVDLFFNQTFKITNTLFSIMEYLFKSHYASIIISNIISLKLLFKRSNN